jgi:hypothetical protein
MAITSNAEAVRFGLFDFVLLCVNLTGVAILL